MHMGASRIVNLQRHRIAQCRSIVIRILGDEGVPVQVDGEAWLHPPGIIRIVHKNRVQLICRDRVSCLKTCRDKIIRRKSDISNEPIDH